MNFLTLEKVTKMYGEKILFKDIDLHIDKGQKIALVAKNGTGKTTLMRVIAGIDGAEGEQSKILFRKDIRIGYLDQDPDFHPDHTIIEAIFDSENPLIQAIKEYEEALVFANKANKMTDAIAKMEELKAWDFESKIKEILFKLNISDLDKLVKNLSGGQKKRLALAKVLIEEPDFLILDEPTNHLDLDMIEWLEEFLQQPNLTLFMVTHDRYFMENVCDVILELEGGNMYRYKGNYSYFLEKKTMRTEIESATLDKNKKLLGKELEWVRRQPKARGTKAKARVDAFHQLKEDTYREKDRTSLEFEIKTGHIGGKIVEFHNVGKKYGEKVILNDFSYKFKRFEKVGIIGANGVGKSSFLKLLTHEENPDKGKVIVGETIQIGHYAQSGLDIKQDKRVLEVIQDIAEYIPLEKGQKLTASALLERFLFSKSQQMVYVSQLSGGEKRRLYLLTILMKNPNFLILDEPTNDLDVLTLNVLEDFLQDYPGCLIVVTHDRYFMDKLVDHLFVFEGDGVVRDFNGTYSMYRAVKELEEEEERLRKSNNDKPKIEVTSDNGTKISHQERKELKQIEKDIAKLESKKAEITEKFNDANLSTTDITRLSKELEEINEKLMEKEERWLMLAEME